MPAPRNDFLPDLKAIHEDVRNPLTVEELRNRLKHIATLCWGLSIDLSTEMSECERVRKENAKLREQVVLLGGSLPHDTRGRGFIDLAKWEAMTPEERAKYAAHAKTRREYQARKAKANARAAYGGKNDGEVKA